MFPFFSNTDDNDYESSQGSHTTIQLSEDSSLPSPAQFEASAAGDAPRTRMTTVPKFVFRRSDLPILNLETDRGEILKAWKTRWSYYINLSNLRHQDSATQVRVLHSCMTPESLVILQNLGVPDDPSSTTVDAVIKKIEEYADQTLNVNLGWHKLTSRTQQDGETVTDYVMSLRQLVKSCDTCNDVCRDRAVRVQLVRGVRNQAITEALLKIRKITLDEAIETALSMEQAKVGGDSLHNETSINRLSTYQKTKKQFLQPGVESKQQEQHPAPPSVPQQCPMCGGRPHTRNTCPATNAVCDQCGEIGHFRRVCRNRQQQPATRPPNSGTSGIRQWTNIHPGPGYPNYFGQNTFQRPVQPRHGPWRPQNRVNQLNAEEQEQGVQQPQQGDFFADWAHEVEDDEFLLSLRCIRACMSSNLPSRRARIECVIFQQVFSVVVLPDSGADVTAVSPEFLQQVGVGMSLIHPPPTTYPTGADGAPLRCHGSINLIWRCDGKQSRDTVLVIDGVTTPLLSWIVAKKLDLLRFNYQPVEDAPPRLKGPTIQKVHQNFALNDANVEKCRQMLLIEFSDVFSDDVTPMKGEQFCINIAPDAVPFCVSAPRTVAFAFREPLRRELIQLQNQGIIEPVTYPTEWCSPIVVEPKKDGVRLCVDFTKLNKFVKREHYYKDPPAILVADIPFKEANYFTTLDAKKGYHQCPLDESSRDLTTFITPFGRFRYKRAPFGISSISEHYNRRMDEALTLKASNTRRQVDDLLIFDKQLQVHLNHIWNILQQCRDAGITLSKEKFRFAEREAVFAGYKITSKGYSIDPKVTQAIRDFPVPKSVTDLRSFFGLVNQLTGLRHDLSTLLDCLRPLLSTKNSFIWTDQHTTAFRQVTQKLSEAPIVSFFDISRPTRILSDASRTGLGFVLQQQDVHSGHWSTVQAGSRFLSPTEARYAAIELELLAICYAFRKCTQFLQGLLTIVVTDHKPLIPILNNKRLDEIENPRLRRMRYFLSQFQLTAQHVIGKTHLAADALSRAPVDRAPIVELKTSLAALQYASPSTHHDLESKIRAHADPVYHDLLQLLLSDGFPHHKNQLQDHLRQFWAFRDELTTQNGLIFYGDRYLIPTSMQREMLNRLHSAHQGTRQTQNFARQFVFWPNMSSEIEQYIANCEQCNRFSKANTKQPLQQPELPVFPFQDISIDFFQVAGKHFLALVDAFSNWPELHIFNSPPTSASLISAIAPTFARFEAPQVLRCDNGSQLTSQQFRQFLQYMGTKLVTSAPYYPQSNGRAENMVKILKAIVKKSCFNQKLSPEKIAAALWAYRNTPSTTDNLSPAVKLLGRNTRGSVPITSKRLTKREDLEEMIDIARQTREIQRKKAKEYYDKQSHILQPVHVGAHGFVRNPKTNEFDMKAVVIQVCDRRIHLRFENGTHSMRDRRDIKPRVLLPRPTRQCMLPLKESLPNNDFQKATVIGDLKTPTTIQPQLRRSERVRRPPNRLQF